MYDIAAPLPLYLIGGRSRPCSLLVSTAPKHKSVLVACSLVL